MLRVVWKTGFDIAAFIRQKPYWQLHEQEAQVLAEKLSDAFDSLPKGTASKFVELWVRYGAPMAPWVALAWAGAAVVTPRVNLEREEAAAQQGPAPSSAPSPGAAPGAAPGFGAGESEVVGDIPTVLGHPIADFHTSSAPGVQ